MSQAHGTIVQTIGAVIDIEFPRDAMPKIYDALILEDSDNKLAENAGWDPELLRLELQYITELSLEFDLTLTGFETAEIDLLLQGKETD